MHVCDVTMFYAPRSGGVRRYIDAKRDWLRANGHGHTLIVPVAPDPEHVHGTHTVSGCPLPGGAGYRVPLGVDEAARAIQHAGPDVIEAADPYQMAWSVLRARDRTGAAAVAFCHSDLPRMASSLGQRAERFAERYLRSLYRHFDLVFAPSAYMTARLDAWGVANAVHQPLGVDRRVFCPAGPVINLRQVLSLPEIAYLSVFAGRFGKEKRLDVLCAAVDILPPRCHLLLVGGIRPPVGITGRVHWLPHMTDGRELAAVLRGCDSFVHAGDQETYGLAALEAMACGLPVVAVDAAGLSEVVPAGAGVLVPRCTSRALADGLEFVMTSDAHRMRDHALAHAARHEWPAAFSLLMSRYAMVAGIKGRAAA